MHDLHDPPHPRDEQPEPLEHAMTPDMRARLRRLATATSTVPPLVDARVRAAIDRRFAFETRAARVERRVAWRIAAGWCAAAVVALAAGASLGSRASGTASPGGHLPGTALAVQAKPFTVLDAFAAARAVRDGAALEPALAARFDLDKNGRLDESDVTGILRLAVGLGREGGTAS